MPNQTDIAIIGGGVMGSAAAYALAKRGVSVTLFEQFRPNHALGSSHGPSRIIRLAYDGADYVALARAAFAGWRDLEAEAGETLLVQTGGLDLGTPDAFALAGIETTFDATGVPYEKLDRDEIALRFPQFNLPEGTIGLYQADYAILAADRCVADMLRLAAQRGAILHTGKRVTAIAYDANGVSLTTASGTVSADRVIVAAGSWTGELLRPLGVDLPLTILREQLAFFEAADPAEFMPGRFPLAIHRFPGTTSLGAAFPIFDHPGVKMIIDRTGPAVLPDDPDRSIDAPLLERLRAYSCDLLPGLTGKILETASCRYTMTLDEDFVLDLHPDTPRVVIASPCSGHGFKFAIVIGDILADLALAGRTPHDIARFRLNRFGA